MNLRSGHGSTSARTGCGLGEDHGKNGPVDDHGNANGESHEAPLLGPPPLPPPPPPMTHAEIMAEMLATHRESARALEMLAVPRGPDGNGGNGGGAHGPERHCSYQDFLGTHPPMFTLTAEPLDAEHWLCILEQKF